MDRVRQKRGEWKELENKTTNKKGENKAPPGETWRWPPKVEESSPSTADSSPCLPLPQIADNWSPPNLPCQSPILEEDNPGVKLSITCYHIHPRVQKYSLLCPSDVKGPEKSTVLGLRDASYSIGRLDPLHSDHSLPPNSLLPFINFF